MVEIPVRGEVLRWARQFRCLDEESAAKKIRISVADLRSYESGDINPSFTMFKKFAHAYKLPQATLFRNSPPNEPSLPTDYRTFEGQPPSHSFEFSVAVSNVREWQNALSKIISDDEEVLFQNLPEYRRNDIDPHEAGERERGRLGISGAEQLSWESRNAFNMWRAIIEAQGVAVYLQKFDLHNDCRGFSLFEKKDTPLIVINRNEENNHARIFTLVHEYAHLLIGEPGRSDLRSRNPVEAYCNKFAAGFLMPASVLKDVLPYWPNDEKIWEDKAIKRCSSQLKVSRQALAIRLESLGFAPKGFNQRYRTPIRPIRESGQNKKGGFVDPVTLRLSEVGSLLAGRVVDAIDRGAVTETAGSEALRLSSEHLPKVREYVQKRRALAGGG